MNEAVTELSIRQLLSDENSYVIPMYQRNYAWGEAEITQLVQDIKDFQNGKNKPYYIGTLVVYKRKNNDLEIIDGQQRFTTLTLLAIYLRNLKLSAKSRMKSPKMDWYQKVNISFDSRPKSTDTFIALTQRIALYELNTDNYNEDIVVGFTLLKKVLDQIIDIDLEDFSKYLFDNVRIMRVEVPEDTDLNHYFEAMNNRGEQLEKHEVLKAKMMEVLNKIEDVDDRLASINTLKKVWESCSNMERYIQYGFSSKERHKLFGRNDWGGFEINNFEELLSCLDISDENVGVLSLHDILSQQATSITGPENSKEEVPERFNSIINFSNFLLHVLRIYTEKDISLDDKRLIKEFEDYLLDSEDPIEDVKSFVFALLKCKYLFDQYVIKREYTQGNDRWSGVPHKK